jgi:hypothetical protein
MPGPPRCEPGVNTVPGFFASRVMLTCFSPFGPPINHRRIVLSFGVAVPIFVALGGLATLKTGAPQWKGLATGAVVGGFVRLMVSRRGPGQVTAIFGPPDPAWRRQTLADDQAADAVLAADPLRHQSLAQTDQRLPLPHGTRRHGDRVEFADRGQPRELEGIVAVRPALDVLPLPGGPGRARGPGGASRSSLKGPARPRKQDEAQRPTNPGAFLAVPICASATLMTSADCFPSPGTALVRDAWSRHFVQTRICRASSFSLSAFLDSGFMGKTNTQPTR